jgi:hypothetical protein
VVAFLFLDFVSPAARVWRILVGYILSVELGARTMKENIVAASGLDEVIHYQHIHCYVILLPRNVFYNVLAAWMF